MTTIERRRVVASVNHLNPDSVSAAREWFGPFLDRHIIVGQTTANVSDDPLEPVPDSDRERIIKAGGLLVASALKHKGPGPSGSLSPRQKLDCEVAATAGVPVFMPDMVSDDLEKFPAGREAYAWMKRLGVRFLPTDVVTISGKVEWMIEQMEQMEQMEQGVQA